MSLSSKSNLLQKAQIRALLREVVKNVSKENKELQAHKVTSNLLNENLQFRKAEHIGVYLTKYDEFDTIPLIVAILNNPDQFWKKQIYVPHVELNAKNERIPEICFYKLKNLFTYHDPTQNRWV